MPEFIEIRDILGISQPRADEIYKDVIKTLEKHKLLDEGIKELTEHYDTEAMLAGMAVKTVLEINKEAYNRRRATALQQGFGQQNASLN